MEALWVDLSADDTEVDSPAWHHEVLERTRIAVMAGEERIEDWDIVKQRLRNRL